MLPAPSLLGWIDGPDPDKRPATRACDASTPSAGIRSIEPSSDVLPKELDQTGNTKLLINLGQTTMMNSIGLGTLFVAHAKYSKRGGTVKLCCVDKKIQQVFVVVRLALVYGDNVHETEEEALVSFRTMEAAPSR